MIYENAKYSNANQTKISVDINGVASAVGKNKSNRHYKEMLAQKISITKFTQPKMTKDEFRFYANAELDRVDKEDIPVDLWEGFTAAKKTKFINYKQALRDAPDTVSLTGVKRGDKAAAIAKLPAKPV